MIGIKLWYQYLNIQYSSSHKKFKKYIIILDFVLFYFSYRKSKLLPNYEEEPHYPSDVKDDALQEMVAEMCTDQVERIFQEAEKKGRRIAAFICEPCMVSTKSRIRFFEILSLIL